MADSLLFSILSCFFVCQVYAQCGVENVAVMKYLNSVEIGDTVTMKWIVDSSAIKIVSFFCAKKEMYKPIAGYAPKDSKFFLRSEVIQGSYHRDLLRRTSIGMEVEGKKFIFTISIADVGVKDADEYECFLEKRFQRDMLCFEKAGVKLNVLDCSGNIAACVNMTVRDCSSDPNVRSMCPKLCGKCPKSHCIDKWGTIACKGWKYHCARKMIQKNCAASCHTCPPPPTLPPTPPPTQPPPCKDKITNCYALKHLCRSSWTIRQNCKITCEQCDSDKKGKTTLPPITEGPLGSCGYPAVKRNHIVSGTDAFPGSWPWQVSLQVGGKHSCGGSIISDRWIVTAAHCVFRDSTYPDTFTVVLGEHNRKVSSGNEVRMSVEKVVVHQSWDYTTFDYDIALLKTSETIIMNDFVHPVCLPTSGPNVGDACYITGWGRSVALGNATEILQEGILRTVSNKDCQARHKDVIDIDVTSRMLCAGGDVRSMTSGCQGDSGGPFVCYAGGRWELQGAVSYGRRMCDAAKAYTVFARITSLKSWIYEKIRSQ